jgi:two-component system, sensor histidine kinase and response regulator
MLKRILVVEDSPVNQKVISRLMHQLAFEFDLAPDGQEAVKASRQHDYALILMDLRLPYMDGFTAARIIRQDGNDVPIVAITSYPLDDDVQRCIEVGMDHLLTKPTDPTDLAHVLNFLVDTQVTRQTLKDQTTPRENPSMAVDQLGDYDATVTQLTHLIAAAGLKKQTETQLNQ